MAVERMGLKEAGELLGITRNAVKARIAAGKLRGERGNLDNKWWVFLDPETIANDKPKGGNDTSTAGYNDTGNDIEKSALLDALTAHIDTLKADLADARAEITRLRPRAEAVDKLQAELDGLRERHADKAAELDRLQKLVEAAGEERRALVADFLAKLNTPPPKPPAAPPPATAERLSWLSRWWGSRKG
ncbi:hypothetical protein [Siccirubricoccus phaeus]|uniref:hypothetical protein n=1 Tax=Siccirubricoccus phaeus TaxID=2595053 RepID=UPI0011F3C3A3|nr:hypothetical protein [Siccirubricoccus phaeus]